MELGEGKSAPGFVPVGEVDVGAGFTDGEIEVEHAGHQVGVERGLDGEQGGRRVVP